MGRKYKSADNVIAEIDSKGNQRLCFKIVIIQAKYDGIKGMEVHSDRKQKWN